MALVCMRHQLRFLKVLVLTLVSTIVLVVAVGRSLSPGEILALGLANVACGRAASPGCLPGARCHHEEAWLLVNLASCPTSSRCTRAAVFCLHKTTKHPNMGVLLLCLGRGSNPHTLRYTILSRARIPIPPPRQFAKCMRTSLP
jgi:hypothetical protein